MSSDQSELARWLSELREGDVYRSIVKDAYSTNDPADNRVEIAAWQIEEEEGDVELKRDDGTLRYELILDFALEGVGATEISERTELKSYADDRGGRAPSTIRGYARNPDRLAGLPSSHPVKRVLRRWARSQDLGHFEDDRAQEILDDREDGPIDLSRLMAGYRMARVIASENGLVFVDREGDPEAIEDNERIDRDEIRRHDRPIGDMMAAVLVTKGDGSIFEYEVDFDARDLVRIDENLPPGGW